MTRCAWLCIMLMAGLVNAQPSVEWIGTAGAYYNAWTFCAVQTADSGYIIGGGIGQAENDAMLVRFNRHGDSLWTRTYPGIGDLHTVVATADGNFVWAGSWVPGIMKTNADGDTLWTQHLECTWFTVMKPAADGGLILAGQSGLMRMSDNGEIVWCHSYASELPGDSIREVVLTSDGGYLLLGYATRLTPPHNNTTFAARVNAVGDTLWTRRYTQSAAGYLPVSGIQTPEGDFLFTRGQQLVRVDSSGNSPRIRIIPAFTYLGITHMKLGRDGNLLMAGDYCTVAKTTLGGNILWSFTYPATPGDYCANVIQTADNGYLCTSQYMNNGYLQVSVLAVKLAPDTIDASTNVGAPSMPSGYALYDNYPNPFNPSTQIAFDLPKTEFVSLKVFDLLGREVASLCNTTVVAGHHTYSFDGSNLTSGLYFYRMTAGEFSATNRMLLLK